MSCETNDQGWHHGMQLQQLPTDTQPEALSQGAQGNLENDVHSSQDTESLEQLVDMELSEYLETTGDQTSPADDLLLSQNSGGLHQPRKSTHG